MRKNYFEGVIRNLKTSHTSQKEHLDFVTLKSYEYWLRTLRTTTKPPSADKCISLFSRKNAFHVLTDLNRYYQALNDAEDKLPAKQKRQFIQKSNHKYSLDKEFQEYMDDLDEIFPTIKQRTHTKDKSVLYQDRQKIISRYKVLVNESNSIDEIEAFVRQFLCGECIFDTHSQKIFYGSFTRELTQALEQNHHVDDSSFRRLNIVQQSFELTDDEMEIVMFTWIFFHKEQCEPLINLLNTHRFRPDDLPSIFKTLYPEMDFDSAVSPQGTLKRMKILDEDASISERICQFLDGSCGNDLDSLYFRTYQGDSVPFKNLAGDDPKVDIALQMLKHVKKGEGLNLFFYGVEGTGKTELAKALAKTLRRPLILTNISIEGINREDKRNSPVSERMGSILYAASKYQNKRAVLLVDEADLILNFCEKGTLNFFLEQIQMPVIWISNSTECVENSTLRRFDYSIFFDRPDAKKRYQIWKSVAQIHKAEDLLSDDDLHALSAEFPITAGGITQAIVGAKKLVSAGCKVDSVKAIRSIATAQATLLNLDLECENRDKESRSPKYLLDALNIDTDIQKVLKVAKAFDDKWKTLQESDRPDSLNMLLYGAPGTGKTEFAKHIARTLDRKIIIKKASDLLDCYVGNTEKNIRKMFQEAEEEKAILFLDEADSMIRDRSGAQRNWEVTQVNEMLTQMESFKGIFIAATNFEGELDTASRRRFALKIKFNYLLPEGIEKIWAGFFPKVACPDAAKKLRLLTPGDFNAAYGSLRFEENVTAEEILKALQSEISYKDSRQGRTMG
ncbi:MAG: ATP-binding protein, partial [Fibrobacter sp.]|nr:ATP-binding protein [Fibrobacter sp.]